MNEKRIKQILDSIKKVKVAVYGDFCLDAYWLLDPQGSEVSVETGLQAQAVKEHHYTLGGASNVVNNLAALEPASIQIVGAFGNDIFARELTRQLHELGVDTTHTVVQYNDFDTVTFAKPYLKGNEQPRVDFGFFNKRSKQTEQALLKGIEHALKNADALIINQQVPGSITNESFIKGLNKLLDKFNQKIALLDSRHYGHKFTNIYRKTNQVEAARLNKADVKPGDSIPLKNVESYAKKLYDKSRKPVFLTRGQHGILTVDKNGIHYAPGIQLLKKLDPVGAGDTVTAALALCLGAGIKPDEAAEFANFAAAVTVQKLFQTGTASTKEIIEIGKDPDYIYQPELAEDPRNAQYLKDSEIEICYPEIPVGKIKHAVFDHDGTISTLRQGWEQIMAPVMIKAILGPQYQTADPSLYQKAKERVLEYIDKSTGHQTIVQMQALVEMVKEFAVVPPDKILDKFGYKKIYNQALMQLVNKRIRKFERGELNITDFTIKGGVEMLKKLQQKNITLYLASGTDKKDVLKESKALGYARYFDGRIYGAVGDINKYSKKLVINKIMTENKLEGPELAVFGDGPVELREARKRRGFAIGLATNEIRRFGLNTEKRTRLIKAGAHIILPDFSQNQILIKFLFKK